MENIDVVDLTLRDDEADAKQGNIARLSGKLGQCRLELKQVNDKLYKAQNELADLRRQLAEAQGKASLWDRMRSRMTDEAMDFLMGHMPQDEDYHRP